MFTRTHARTQSTHESTHLLDGLTCEVGLQAGEQLVHGVVLPLLVVDEAVHVGPEVLRRLRFGEIFRVRLKHLGRRCFPLREPGGSAGVTQAQQSSNEEIYRSFKQTNHLPMSIHLSIYLSIYLSISIY